MAGDLLLPAAGRCLFGRLAATLLGGFCQLGAASSAATAISASVGAGSATGTEGIAGSSPADS